MRDFANATKHGGYLKNSNRVLDEVKRNGRFGGRFSGRFDRIRLELHIAAAQTEKFKEHLRKGQYLDTNETLESCLRFWTDLYQGGRIPPKSSNRQVAGSGAGTGRQRITLPGEIDSATKQLDIASEMADSALHDSTPATTYLTAAAIAPLEHWAYEELKVPMEFPNKRAFRQFVDRESPSARAIRELAQAAKNGARIIVAASRAQIALKKPSSTRRGKSIRGCYLVLAENPVGTLIPPIGRPGRPRSPLLEQLPTLR